MTSAFRTVTTSITILPEGASIFEENATRIEIRDEGSGPFLEISQTGLGAIVIEADNWPAIRDGVNKMMETLPMQLSDEEIALRMTGTSIRETQQRELLASRLAGRKTRVNSELEFAVPHLTE